MKINPIKIVLSSLFILHLQGCGKSPTQVSPPSPSIPTIMNNLAAPSSKNFPWQNIFKLSAAPQENKNELVLRGVMPKKGEGPPNRPLCEMTRMLDQIMPDLLRLDESLCMLKEIKRHLYSDKSRKARTLHFLLPSFPDSTFLAKGRMKESAAGVVTEMRFDVCRNETPSFILSYRADSPSVKITTSSTTMDGPLKRNSILEIQGLLNGQSEWINKQVRGYQITRNKKINYRLASVIHQFPKYFSVSSSLSAQRGLEIGEEIFEHSLYSVVRGSFRKDGLRLGEGSAKVRIGRFFNGTKRETPFNQEWIDSWDKGTYLSLPNPESGEFFQVTMDGAYPPPSSKFPPLPNGGWDCHSVDDREMLISPENNGQSALFYDLKNCLAPLLPLQADWSDCRNP